MAKKHFFWLRWYDSTLDKAIEKRIEVDPQRNLGSYYDELKLWGLRRHARVMRLRDSIPMRHYYVPQSGDVIAFQKTAAMS